MTEQIEKPHNNTNNDNIKDDEEISSRSASNSSLSTSSSTLAKKSLSPAPIPSTTAWNVVKSDVVPSIDFNSIIPPKKAAAPPAAASSNTRRNRKKSKKREGGNEKKVRSHSRTQSRTQQPFFFSDISIGAHVDWPSPQAKQSSIEACAQQLEYYFSINNLLKDMYLRKHMNSQGWIFLNDVAKFTRMRAISGGDTAVLQDSLKLTRNISWGFTQSHDFQHLKLRSNITPENWVLPLTERLPSGTDEASPSETHSIDN